MNLKKWESLTAQQRDILIAEKVMGYQWWTCDGWGGKAALTDLDLRAHDPTWRPAPPDAAVRLEPLSQYFSRNMIEAWRVVKRMTQNGFSFCMAYEKNVWRCVFARSLVELDAAHESESPFAEWSVCLAALVAMGCKDD